MLGFDFTGNIININSFKNIFNLGFDYLKNITCSLIVPPFKKIYSYLRINNSQLKVFFYCIVEAKSFSCIFTSVVLHPEFGWVLNIFNWDSKEKHTVYFCYTEVFFFFFVVWEPLRYLMLYL